MAKKRKRLIVLEPMQIPPHLTKCRKCDKERWAYALEDDQTPPRYLCEGCYESMIRAT